MIFSVTPKRGLLLHKLDKQAQSLFDFKCQDSKTKVIFQYCYTVLPQRFKNSLTIFSEILVRDLSTLHLTEGILLQYVGDLSIANMTFEACLSNTITLLNHLAHCRYKESPLKSLRR